MKSFRKCIAILLAVSFAVPVDGGPLRERMRANRTRRESRQRVTPEMEKSIAKGIEKAGDPADKPAGEQQGTVAAMGSIGGGTIDPGASTTLDGLLDVNAGSPSDNDVLTWDAGTSTWINEAGGGGSGITIDGAIGDGQTVAYDDTDDVYVPSYAGAPVYDVTKFIGGIRCGGSSRQTTGTVSAASNSMTVAAGWDAAEGHCIAIQGAGADHSLGTPNAPFVMTIGTAGATSRDYRVSAGSGNGGVTQCSTITTLTTSHATLDATNYNRIFIDAVTGALGGYAIYGRDTTDANQFKLTEINSCVMCYKLTFDAGGYNDFETADLGTSITAASGSHTGTIVGFDNTARTCYVIPAAWDGGGADTFPSATSTATGGGDGGTTSGAATGAVYWNDQGDTVTATPYMTLARRNSTRMYVGQRILHPQSSSGVMYRVFATNGDEKTAGSAPSFDTDYGDLTQDGNVTFIREDTVFPNTPPAAAIYDFLRTSISAVSGTTITTAGNATTSVTSKLVFRDDLTPAQAWWDVCRASGGLSTLHWPGDREYPFIPGPVTGASRDSRWGTATGAGNNQHALFNWYYASGTRRLKRAWHLEEGARILMMPLDSTGSLTDDLTTAVPTCYLWRYAYSEPMVHGGGEISYSPIGEPVLEHDSGWNFTFIDGELGDATYNIAGPYWTDTDFFGWPRLNAHFHQPSPTQPVYISNCNFTYGGADHDGGWYFPGGHIIGGSIVGVRYTRSTGLYQDDNTIDTALLIDGLYAEGMKKDGVRVRADNFTLVNSVFYDCVMVRPTEHIVGCNVSNNTFNRTNILTAFSSQGADDVTISGNTMIDSRIVIDPVSDRVVVAKNKLTFGSTATSNLTASDYAIVASGSDTKIVENFVDTSTLSGDYRAFTVTGTSNRVWVEKNTFRGNGVWETAYFTGTGRRWVTDNYFYNGGGGAGSGGYGGMIIASGTADYKFKGNVWEDATASNSATFSTGGRLEFDGDTFLCQSYFTTGITGPLYVKNCMHLSSTTTAMNKANGIYEGNNFAVLPTLNGATQATRGNRVADSLSVTAAALASGVNNDVALPVTDQVRLDPNAANSTVTSFVARADGTEVTIICTDAGAATITIDSSAATGTAANKIMCPGDVDIVMSTGERIVIRYDATTSLWYVIGGQYVAMDWQGGAIQLWQQGEQFNQPATREWALAA